MNEFINILVKLFLTFFILGLFAFIIFVRIVYPILKEFKEHKKEPVQKHKVLEGKIRKI